MARRRDRIQIVAPTRETKLGLADPRMGRGLRDGLLQMSFEGVSSVLKVTCFYAYLLSQGRTAKSVLPTAYPPPTPSGDRLVPRQLGVRLSDFEVRCQALQRPHQ
jgi:hypothetical protein